MSSSALTTIENLQDALTEAFRPIGTGFLDMMRASEGGVMSLIDLVADVGRQIGEVLSAIGKSGVLQDLFSKLLDNAGVANFQEGMINAVSYILAYIGQIPDLWHAIVTDINNAFTYAKDWIIYSFGVAFDWITDRWNDLLKMINSTKFSFMGIDLGGVLAHGGGSNNDPEKGKRLIPTMAPWMTPGAFGMANHMGEVYKKAITGSLGPQGLPDGIMFGGGLGNEGGPSLKDTLGKIEKNTKDTADSLTLRKETLGGGKLGALGASVGDFTPAEAGGYFTGGDFFSRTAPIQAGTDFERAMRRMMRDEARKAGTPGGLNRRF